ncbi:phospholipase D-like domain-containing protein [Methanobacterium alcaliphilum]|uniref:phospholipase D-like domain-containing protein n=1 Tax=Methanobacterium alcaliphilum TaxID=392018 RepID=UPI00200B36EA|nr:phosphatidylserine/phosphatidylglycerophosphate/cardiolipin synthase family protein [Methanobacterium alcaliphilum]MCK9151693.1 phosphatidylserine/phosphatidylglycerophosphate/cardiolipin synthase family protein [Methanobacterium alcaliphilum]
MEKIKVSGKLVDDKEKPLFNIKLNITADHSSLFDIDPVLAETVTDNQGKFSMEFIPTKEFMENKKNQIKIEFFIDDKNIMELSKDIKEEIIDFGIINFHEANIGIEGRIIDDKGDPIEGLTVIAEDVDYGKLELNALELLGSKVKSLFSENISSDDGFLGQYLGFIKNKYDLLFSIRDDYLGSSVTDENGYYRIIYHPDKYREILDKEPDIRIIVKDRFGVFELRKTGIYQDIKCVIEKIDDLIINRAEIEGWESTLKTDTSSRVTNGNNIEILIDNQQAWEKMVQVIDKAESYIYLTQFVFYPEFIPRFFTSSQDPSTFQEDETLAYKLLQAQKKGVDVKIIINENRVVPDNYDELYDYFKDSGVEVRRFPAKGPFSMHAKVIVADGKRSFIIGSPFTQSYWDTSKHDINEPRRLEKNEGPYHDVSTYFEGPVIHHIEEFFIELWNYLSDLHFDGQNKIMENKSKNQKINNSFMESGPDINPLLQIENETVQIVRSITPQTLSKKGELGVLESYRKAINNAQEFIYLENQYFTNKYIVGALKRAVELNPHLQVILLINEVPDVPTYRSWQHYGFEVMGIDLKKLIIEHPQIGVFAKWSGKFQNGKNKLSNCYIHSKVAIVDDKWATIGTANLDGSSLSCAEEFGSSETSTKHRNMEMNAVLFDKDSSGKGNIENFRRILWSEHMGMDIIDFKRPRGGWLDLWKDKGFENISHLSKEEIILHGGILPYSTKNNPKEQIKDLVEQYRRLKARFNR